MLLDQGRALEVAILFGLEEDGAIGRSIGVGRSEVKFDPFYFYIVLIFAGADELVFLGCTGSEGCSSGAIKKAPCGARIY